MRVTADDIRSIALAEVNFEALGLEWDGTIEAFRLLDVTADSEPGADDGPWAVYAGQVIGQAGRVAELPGRVAAIAFAAGIMLGARPHEAKELE